MTLPDLVLLILGVIAGAIASLIISRFYYLKTVTKKLTPYLYIGTAILEGTDPEIREKLKIKFLESNQTESINEIDVKNPYQLEFIIVNDGELPIRDCIQPLSIKFPGDARLISTNIMGINLSRDRLTVPGIGLL